MLCEHREGVMLSQEWKSKEFENDIGRRWQLSYGRDIFKAEIQISVLQNVFNSKLLWWNYSVPQHSVTDLYEEKYCFQWGPWYFAWFRVNKPESYFSWHIMLTSNIAMAAMAASSAAVATLVTAALILRLVLRRLLFLLLLPLPLLLLYQVMLFSAGTTLRSLQIQDGRLDHVLGTAFKRKKGLFSQKLKITPIFKKYSGNFKFCLWMVILCFPFLYVSWLYAW